MMEFVLRCNSTKCRAQLNDRAVVTTCSHIFCLSCAETLGLSTTTGLSRVCPACDQQLHNADDVIVQLLALTEEQKSVILSGLSPGIIMECAGRAIGFYSYQAMQEIAYQEYIGKHLTEKYSNLHESANRLAHDANMELETLRNRLSALQMEKRELEEKNHELVEAFREKSKTQQRVQKMYQSLKAQVMASQTQYAAVEDVENTLHAEQNQTRTKFPDTSGGHGDMLINRTRSGMSPATRFRSGLSSPLALQNPTFRLRGLSGGRLLRTPIQQTLPSSSFNLASICKGRHGDNAGSTTASTTTTGAAVAPELYDSFRMRRQPLSSMNVNTSLCSMSNIGIGRTLGTTRTADLLK